MGSRKTNSKLFQWDYDTTIKFIEERIANADQFNRKKNSANVEYKNIIERLKLPITPVQAKAKWQNLVTKYKNLKSPPTGMGVEMDDETATNWGYFEIMDKFMAGKHTINPTILISSSTTNSGLNIIETKDREKIINLEIEESPESNNFHPKKPKGKQKDPSDEMINIAKEGNAILERAVNAFEEYIQYKMRND